jgi:hypothetical protein
MKVEKYKLTNILFSLIVASIFCIINWEAILSEQYFEDRRINRLIFESGFNKLNYVDVYYNSALSYLTNEWGWEFFLYIVNDIFGLSFNLSFGVISFFAVFISNYIFISYFPKKYSILLYNPWFFDFIYSQSRLAFAITLIGLAFFLRKTKIISFILILYALTVHTSILIFLLIFIVSYYFSISDYYGRWLKNLIAIVIGIIIALLTGPVFLSILLYFGDRRVDVYEKIDMSNSVITLLPWIVMYFIFILNIFKGKFIKDFPSYVSLIILTIVFFNTVIFEGYVIRFLVAVYPLIIFSIFKQLNKNDIKLFLLFYLFYLLLGWYLRFFILWS